MPFLSYCIYKLSIQTAVVDEGGRFDLVPTGTGFGEGGRIPAGKIRKFFPETWIWDLIPVGYVSCTMALLFLCKAVVFVYVYLAFVLLFFWGGGLHTTHSFLIIQKHSIFLIHQEIRIRGCCKDCPGHHH